MSRWFIILGAILVTAGVALHYAPWLFSWFGRLPGDIRIETERTRIFIPITSMVLISAVITVVVNLLRR